MPIDVLPRLELTSDPFLNAVGYDRMLTVVVRAFASTPTVDFMLEVASTNGSKADVKSHSKQKGPASGP